MVRIEVSEKSDAAMVLVLKGVPLEFANAIRRAALEEVPTLAVDYVVFYDNTSALSDEIIAHRVAMVPLKSDLALDRYRQPEECRTSSPPEGCYTSLYLEAETGPQEERVIYSRDLKPQEDPEVVPVYGDIPLIKLGPQQRVILEAWVRPGRGKEHIKWSPTTVSVLTHIPEVKVDAERCNLCRLCVERCPTKAISVADGRLVIDTTRCNLCRQCVSACEPEAIELSWRKDEYRLLIESSGSLKPERIFLEAVLQIKKKLAEFQRQFEEVFSVVGGES